MVTGGSPMTSAHAGRRPLMPHEARSRRRADRARDDGEVPGSTASPADLTPHLPDLERSFDPEARRDYEPVALVRFALSWPTDHWPGLALDWLDQGVPSTELVEELGAFENERNRPQAQRHQARRLRKAAQE